MDHAGPAALAGLWVVALDTNSLALPEAAKTAARQLQWLEETLAAAAAQRAAVLIAGHIAPGASHTDWRSIGEVANGSTPMLRSRDGGAQLYELVGFPIIPPCRQA